MEAEQSDGSENPTQDGDATGFPEPEGKDPGDRTAGKTPYSSLNNPVGEPDPTEYPDPYDTRDDPRDPEDPDGEPFGEEPHPATGSSSTSEPHPAQDPGAQAQQEKYDRENLDE